MWFTKHCRAHLLPKFISVMDNASVHLVSMEMVPCANMRQTDIMAWLSSKHITHSASQKHTISQVNTMNWTPVPSYTVIQWCNCSHITDATQSHMWQTKATHTGQLTCRS